GAPLFLAFKHGFVRQEGHLSYFADTVLLSLAYLLLFTTKKRETLLLFLFFAGCLFGFLSWPASTNIAMYDFSQSIRHKILLTDGLQNLRVLVNFPFSQKGFDLLSAKYPDPQNLPATTIETVQKDNATVDVIPLSLSYCPANKL